MSNRSDATAARAAALRFTREKLPVWGFLGEIGSLLQQQQLILLIGETGSGKTTQVPSFLLDALPRATGQLIACTQPRRVAAMSVSKRVSEELGVTLGEEVGYSIRFDDACGPKTVLKYLTDGMLLREAMDDATLRRYAAIVLDEAHERTLSTDLLFGLVKKLLPLRPELKVVVMSATLDSKKLRSYFDDAPLLTVPGRLHPVQLYYSPQPVQDYLDAAIRTVLQIHLYEKAGDVLVFLTGEEEIEEACRKTKQKIDAMPQAGEVLVLPLYATLPMEKQRLVFDPPPRARKRGGNAAGGLARKVVFATNVAETSLTIDGVVFVVDSGFAKQKLYNPRLRVESLVVSPISRAAAKQRAGRAGRTRPGKCFRLYTEAAFSADLLVQSYPEVLRSELSSLVLQLKRLSVPNVAEFDFIDAPAPETMMRALELLYHLGALDSFSNLTATGKMLAELPLEPQLGKMLLQSVQHGCVEEALTLTSLLSLPSPFMRPRELGKVADAAKAQFSHATGDHLTLLRAYAAYRAQHDSAQWAFDNFLNARTLKAVSNVRVSLAKLLKRFRLELTQPRGSVSATERQCTVPAHGADQAVCSCLLSGFFIQVARHERGAQYRTLNDNQLVSLHPSSVVKSQPQWVCYQEYVLTTKSYIRTCTEVQPEWLLAAAPHFYTAQALGRVDSTGARELLALLAARTDLSVENE